LSVADKRHWDATPITILPAVACSKREGPLAEPFAYNCLQIYCKAAEIAAICACVSAIPPLVARMLFLMLFTPNPAVISAAVAPRFSDDASGLWQLAQLVA